MTTDDRAIRRAGRRARRLLGRVARKTGLRPTVPAPPPPPRYGPKPEVVLDETNYGPMMDRIVERARRNQRALRVNPDYDLVRQHFDHYNFMLSAVALQDEPGLDPIRVFLHNGAEAINSPDVNFSMRNYLVRYPEHAEGPERSPYLEWLKRGKEAGEIADPAPGIESMATVLGLEPARVVELLVETRTDLQHRLRYGVLGEMIAKAAEIEPLIGAVWSETTKAKQLPFGSPLVVAQVAAVHACQEMAGFRRARLLLVVNKPRWGGGRRMEGHIAHALMDRIAPEDIVVIYTDEGGRAPEGRFPAGVREVDFAAAVGEMPTESAGLSLVSLIRSFEADAVVNINSRTLYTALTAYGRALAASERIFLAFFCNEQRAQGNWEGWSLKWFYRAFDFVEAVLTDSDYLRDWLADAYQLGDDDRSRIHVLRAPVEPELGRLAATEPAALSAEPGRRPQVFWAGRWDRQKRVDIALAVATRMPDVDFRLWGEAVLQEGGVGALPDNVSLEGRYGHISELDIAQADAWLYTSAWDGVPSLLLEVAMAEVPIVGSLVGGTGEVLSEEDSWPIAAWEDPEAYEKALRDVLADPAGARRRAAALRERLERDRTQQAYAETAAGLLLVDDPRKGDR